MSLRMTGLGRLSGVPSHQPVHAIRWPPAVQPIATPACLPPGNGPTDLLRKEDRVVRKDAVGTAAVGDDLLVGGQVDEPVSQFLQRVLTTPGM
jgi:hypothetical protein